VLQLSGKTRMAENGTSNPISAVLSCMRISRNGEPRLFALNLLGEQRSRSVQPLVPERMFMLGGGSIGNGDKPVTGTAFNGLLPALLSLLVSEKSGLELTSEKKAGNIDQPEAGSKSAEG
jgi:hypothetical protein